MRTALLLVLSVLVGCTAPNNLNNPNLKVACALTQCTCVSGGGSFFNQKQTTTAVLWTERGNAYCPEGFSLRQAAEKKNQYYTPR